MSIKLRKFSTRKFFKIQLYFEICHYGWGWKSELCCTFYTHSMVSYSFHFELHILGSGAEWVRGTPKISPEMGKSLNLTMPWVIIKQITSKLLKIIVSLIEEKKSMLKKIHGLWEEKRRSFRLAAYGQKLTILDSMTMCHDGKRPVILPRHINDNFDCY